MCAAKFPNNLRGFRIARKISQPMLAKAADTNVQNVSRIERGERRLTREWAELFAPHLGTTAQELMFSSPGATKGTSQDFQYPLPPPAPAYIVRTFRGTAMPRFVVQHISAGDNSNDVSLVMDRTTGQPITTLYAPDADSIPPEGWLPCFPTDMAERIARLLNADEAGADIIPLRRP